FQAAGERGHHLQPLFDQRMAQLRGVIGDPGLLRWQRRQQCDTHQAAPRQLLSRASTLAGTSKRRRLRIMPSTLPNAVVSNDTAFSIVGTVLVRASITSTIWSARRSVRKACGLEDSAEASSSNTSP